MSVVRLQMGLWLGTDIKPHHGGDGKAAARGCWQEDLSRSGDV